MVGGKLHKLGNSHNFLLVMTYYFLYSEPFYYLRLSLYLLVELILFGDEFTHRDW